MPTDLTLYAAGMDEPDDDFDPDEHPALRDARRRRRERKAQERQQTEAEALAEVEEVPEPQNPALEDARRRGQQKRDEEILKKSGSELSDEERARKIQLLDQQRKALTDPQQNQGALGDVWTATKIGSRQFAQGPAITSEAERGLKDLTTKLVANSLPADDVTGIEAIAGKSSEEMNWREWTKAAEKFYGNSETDWHTRKRYLMGFQPGDHNDPTGEEAFPEAFNLIAGAEKGSNFIFSAGFIPNLQGIYEMIARPILYEDDTAAQEAADGMAQALVDLRQEYSDKAREQDELPFIREEATWNPLTWFDPNDETKGLRGIFNATVEQAPMIGGMIVSSRVGGRTGAGYSVRKFGRPTDTLEDIVALQKSGARWGGAAAGGATEMALIRDGVFHETHTRLTHDTSDEAWQQNEDFQRLTATGEITADEAKQIIGYEYANRAGDMAMVISGAMLGTPMGAFYGSMSGVSGAREAAKDAILSRMAKGAALEVGQEMAQEGFEQISGNLQAMKVDDLVKWYTDVPNALAGAAFVSGPYGALGAIPSDKGAGIAIAKDKFIRESMPWVRAMNERVKFQEQIGKKQEDQSPQERLKNMIELERLQEKEAQAFMKASDRMESLLDQREASPEERVAFEAKRAAYETDIGMIAKRKKARIESRRELEEEKRVQAERDAARKQVERDVAGINESMRLVENMQAVVRGDIINQQDYDELARAGYGVWMGKNQDNFVLTDRGQRAMQEMAQEAIDTQQRIEAGISTGERRTQRVLRESFENMSDEEFERQVYRDPTTGLWNKRKLNEDLKQDAERKRGQKDPKGAAGQLPGVGGFAFLDADSLKWVNDNMSYSAGNDYLRTITRELENLGQGFEAYRWGGDEIVVTGPNQEAVQKAVESALGRINRAPRITEAGKSVKVAVSTGFGETQKAAELSMKQDKERRTTEGLRQDTRVADSAPPTLQTEGVQESDRQMSLFALAAQGNKFDDDAWKSTNYWIEEDWQMYDMAVDQARARRQTNTLMEVDSEHYQWIEETAHEFLPQTNTNNPPVTILHDYNWLEHLAPNQYRELMDLPFGAMGVRGLFSMDDPSHGVFLFADVIISEAKAKLPAADKLQSWNAIKYGTKEGDTIEVIDEEGNVQIATVKSVSYKPYVPQYRGTYSRYGSPYGVAKVSQSQKRLEKEGRTLRLQINKLTTKSTNLLKQHSRMSAAKRQDKEHPLNKQLMDVFDQLGALESDYALVMDAINLEQSRRWLENSQQQEALERQRELDLQERAAKQAEADTREDQITVEMKDGTTIKFDPHENAPIKVYGQEGAMPDVYIGRIKAPHSKTWRSNLGNEEAATPPELTKDDIAEVVADTIMHESIGHFGVRGITKDWDNYVSLTHALTDAFPEVVERLRIMGYNYRDDLDRPGAMNDANKALLGEEVMAWTAGEILGKTGMEGMNATQAGAISKFMTWFKVQLLKAGYNKLYRRRQAQQIRTLRRKLNNAKTDEQRDAISKKLYGYTENGKRVPGLVYVGESGVRRSQGWGGKRTPTGKLVRSQQGFLNDQDLLNIIQRSLDFVRTGRTKWKFKDHAGNSHTLPMRNLEMYRKPVHYVMLNGVRKRTESEKITEEDLAPPPAVPTIAEAYEQLFGESVPEGFRVITPADFKDESKRIEREMTEGKTPEEIKQMRKDRLIPNPKQLYDEAVKDMSPEMLQQAGQVQSLIASAKKEGEKRDAALKAKRRSIEQLEARWGKDVVESDEIPVFPESATIQGFLEATKQALPTADGGGFVTQAEVEASGIFEKLWPSRIKSLVQDYNINERLFYEKVGDNEPIMTKERFLELNQPATTMTREEADKVIDMLKRVNETNQAMLGHNMVPELHLHAKKLSMNSAMTAKDLRAYMSDWVLSGHDPNISTLLAVYGEESQLVDDYIALRERSISGDPNEQAKARREMEEIMSAPINPSQVVVPKDWVAQKIATPKLDIIYAMPSFEPEPWQNHYERITGEKPPSDYYDPDYITDRGVRAEVKRRLAKDRDFGPDVGYDEVLGQWIELPISSASKEWANLMVDWAVPDSYFATVFWQRPWSGGMSRGPSTGHFSGSTLRPYSMQGARGIFGHMRNAASYDADPDAPIAPNPSKQGQAFMPFEHQTDAFQDAAGMWNSEQEQNQADHQRRIDGAQLESITRAYVSEMLNLALDQYEKIWNEVERTTTIEEILEYVDDNYESGVTDELRDEAEEKWNALNQRQQQQVRQATIAWQMYVRSDNPLQNFYTAMNNMETRARAASEGINKAVRSSGQQASEFDQGRNREMTFIPTSDARMFEWADHRAVGKIAEEMRSAFGWIHNWASDHPGTLPNSKDPDDQKEWSQWAEKRTGGTINKLRQYLSARNGAIPDGLGDLYRSINQPTHRLGSGAERNRPGHRIPWMRDVLNEQMAQTLEELNVDKPQSKSYLDVANEMYERATQQNVITMTADLEMYANVFGKDQNEIASLMEDWATNNAHVPFYTARHRNGTEFQIHIFGKPDDLAAWEAEADASLREHFAVKLNDGTLAQDRSALSRKKRDLERSWWRYKRDLDSWRDEFKVQEASYRVTDDVDNPLELKSEQRANGLTIDDVHERFESYGVQTFPQYTQSRWERMWRNADQEDLDNWIAQGATEETPHDEMYEQFANEWNDSTPMVMTGRFPVAWTQQSEPTDWQDFIVIKEKVEDGDWYKLKFWDDSIGDWREHRGLDYYDVQHELIADISTWYEQNHDDGNPNPYRFKTLRPTVRDLKAEIKRLQERIEGKVEEARTGVTEIFETEAGRPSRRTDPAEDGEAAILRVIAHSKKSGWTSKQMMNTNDQWRNAQMMAAISEAVRQGYARIHMPYGSASGRRGGFLSRASEGGEYWHYTNNISWELKTKNIRGKDRQIVVVKPDNTADSFWFDVTEDRLAPFTGKEPNDDDALSGYMSQTLITEMGRDVAGVIAQKMMQHSGEGAKKKLLVTGSGDNWFVVNTEGKILSEHPSKRAAQNKRTSLMEEQAAMDDVRMSGTVSRYEIGGPIMFIKANYYGGNMYNLTSRDQYQHTFQPPTFAGMRRNYDSVQLSRYRAYLKKFGLEIEEGWAKVESSRMHDVQYSEGGRQPVRVVDGFADKYPNLRVEEVQGEDYGWVVMSDNGLAKNQIFANQTDADTWLNDLVGRNMVEEGNRVKVYQITINDALREEHSKPVNPWVNAHAQIDKNDPVLRRMLAKIGEPKRSWLDNWNPFKKVLRAEFVQGALDRFYGIKFALQQTGKSLDSYKMARLTTGIDSMMRAVFEYGAPVWRDGVMEVEGEGLMQALAGVSDDLEHWAAFIAGRRAKGLILEGYNKLDEGEKRGIDRIARHFDDSKKVDEEAGGHMEKPPYTEEERATDEHMERVWKALVYMSTRYDNLMPKFSRRTFLRGLGAGASLGAAGMLPIGEKGSLGDFNISEVEAEEVIKGAMSSAGGSMSRAEIEQKINDWAVAQVKADPGRWGTTKKLADKSRRSIIHSGPGKRAKAAINEALAKKRDQMMQSGQLKDVVRDALDQAIDADAQLSGGAFDQLLEMGREKNFDPEEAQKAIQYGEQFDDFEIARNKYNRWRKKLLDFAQEAGVINAQSREAWEESDYIPFFRIVDDRMMGPAGGSAGIADQRSTIKPLKGVAFNTGDLIHNMFMGAAKLVDAAVKNNAAKAAITELEGTGLIRKVPHDFGRATIPGTELKKLFAKHNLDTDYIPPEVVKAVHGMFGIVPPKGDGIVSVMIDGKPVYYRTEDELLFRSLTSVNHNVVHSLFWRGPKKLLTSAVTLDPGFMVANFIRDSMSAWVLNSNKGVKGQYIPIVDGLRGAVESLRTGDSMQAMMAAGASFESGYIRSDDPKSTHRYIKNAMKDAGFRRSILDNARKLGRVYMQIGSSLENANRVAIYQAALRSGKTPLQAAFEAKDIMDFSMGGDWATIQWLVQSVPFFNARLQGLYRLGRGARENPVAFAFKGFLLTMAGMSLWLKFRDDERYKRLEDWDKDAYFHFWIGEHHWRIPKGFEIGAIFNTIPERAMEYVWSNENDAGRTLLKRMGHMISETFAMNPIPQTIQPIAELASNENWFTQRKIESPWEEKRLSPDRYRYYTSPTMIELAAKMPQMETVMNGKISSPLHLQNLWNGYTGTLGRYALMGADIIMRETLDYPVPPEMPLERWPVISRFYRGVDKPIDPEYMAMTPEERLDYDIENNFPYESPRSSKYEQEFYNELNLIVKMQNSLSNARRNLEPDMGDARYREIEREYLPQLVRAGEFEAFQDQLSNLNREIRRINLMREDPETGEEVTKEQKREMIDDIERQKSAIYRLAYDRRPSAVPQEELDEANEMLDEAYEDMDYEAIIDGYDPSLEPDDRLVASAPQTARLLDSVGSQMNANQLARLARAGNYTQRGE